MPDNTVMLKLKPGFAPGLAEGRPLRGPAGETVPRYRWIPSPARRRQGFKTFYLLGASDEAAPIDAEGWRGLGFAAPPVDGLTLDGPPLGLEAAARACRQIAEAAKTQHRTGAAAPAAARPAPAARTLNEAFDRFFEECAQGNVKKRDKTGRPVPIKPKTVDGYRKALEPVRELAGDQSARGFSRDELTALCEAYIDNGHHPMAVAIQRAVSRAMNYLRNDVADWRPHLPGSHTYSRLGLGTPAGRLRMALPDEADAMFTALNDPAALGRELGLHADDLPPPRPGLAAAWLMALWTIQRGVDTMSFTEAATASDRLYWIQSKTGTKVDIPMLDQAKTARRLAIASRAGLGEHGGRLFMDSEYARPYLQVTRKTGLAHYRNANAHWTAARALAGRKVPRLLGKATDPWGDPVPELWFTDSRDTGVTRLFEAFQWRDGALASISRWHGSDIKTLLHLMKHYLVLNPTFADAGGEALRKHAAAAGFEI